MWHAETSNIFVISTFRPSLCRCLPTSPHYRVWLCERLGCSSVWLKHSGAVMAQHLEARATLCNVIFSGLPGTFGSGIIVCMLSLQNRGGWKDLTYVGMWLDWSASYQTNSMLGVHPHSYCVTSVVGSPPRAAAGKRQPDKSLYPVCSPHYNW